MIFELVKINELAKKYFKKQLQNSKQAKKYVKNRISDETIEAYEIGYAPWSGLTNFLVKKHVNLDLAEKVGLVTTDFEDVTYETFSNRIMIPIHHAGWTIGFGGRTLANNPKKYINSKTSILYNKKEVLFGLDTARGYIYKQGYALVVEGYFDVLGLASAGIKNVVAICGSAFTTQHAELLARYTDKVFTLFDGDDAGRQTGVNAKRVLKRKSIFGGIILLPNGYDPDTFVQKHGKNKLKRLKIVK